MKNTNLLSADRAIETPDEDILGRNFFAEKLASLVTDWEGNESLVISLNGPWGCGKTSLKNLIRYNLKGKVLYFDFNPWVWSGRNNLIEIFFNEFSLKVLSIKNKKNKFGNLAKKLRFYGELLSKGGIISHGIKCIAYIFIIILISFGASIIHTTSFWDKFILCFLVVSFVITGLSSFAQSLSRLFERLRDIHDHTIEENKKTISDVLKDNKELVLIVIDDIDRLSDKEIIDLFQLVKLNADFFNTIYLLIFDTNRVKLALDKVHGNGDKYLEKIIQVPFTVPKIETNRLNTILFDSLNEILLSNESMSKKFEKDRWGRIHNDGIKYFITSLRDVKRLISSLEFHSNIFINKDAFDVNPVDLIALEVIRVFEPRGYASLHSFKNILIFNEYMSTIYDKKEKDIFTKKATEWLENNFSLKNILPSYAILANMFPDISGLYNGYHGYPIRDEDESFRLSRICHPKIFERYFQLSIPDDQISQSEIDSIIKATNDAKIFNTLYRIYKMEGKEYQFLSTLNCHKTTIPKDNANNFLLSLMDIADDLSDGFMSQFNAFNSAGNTALIYLMEINDIHLRYGIIKEAFVKSSGISLMRGFIGYDSAVNDKRSTNDRILPEEKYEELVKMWVDKNYELLEKDILNYLSKQQVKSNIFSLHIHDSDNAKNYFNKKAENIFLELMHSLISLSHSSSKGLIKKLKHDEVCLFLDFELVEKLYAKNLQNELNEKERETMALIKEMLERKANNIPDDNF